jgi:hypothetical protein
MNFPSFRSLCRNFQKSLVLAVLDHNLKVRLKLIGMKKITRKEVKEILN